jgi:hypothetical protein
LVSIVVGIVVGFLFATGNIPFITTAFWIALGIAAAGLIILVVALFIGADSSPTALTGCLCQNAICLLIGILGTIVLAIIGLSTVLVPGLMSSVIFVALGSVFLTILLISLVTLIVCIINKMCCNVLAE